MTTRISGEARERAAFEALYWELLPVTQRDARGGYQNMVLNIAWVAWMKRAQWRPTIPAGREAPPPVPAPLDVSPEP